MVSTLCRQVTRSTNLALLASLMVAGLAQSASGTVLPTQGAALATSGTLPTAAVQSPVVRTTSSTGTTADYGTGYARLTRRHRSWVNVYTRSQALVTDGTKFTATAKLRSERRRLGARLRVREVVGTRVLTTRTVSARAVPRTWRQVRVSLRASAEDSQIQVLVSARVPSRRAAIRVSGVRLDRTAPPAVSLPVPTPTPSPTPTPTSSPTPSPTPTSSPTSSPTPTPTPESCVSQPQGIPASGAYSGATVSGTSSLPAREAALGQTLPIRRTYWGPTGVTKAVATAAEDVKAKRLPWVSFKLPATWAAMADGAQDAWANDVIRRLDAVDGPVWLAFHHEPENDTQPLAEWTRMQARLGRLVKAQRSDNIAFSIIVMGWHQIGGTADKRLPALWPGDGIVDIIGLDPYNWYNYLKDNGTRDMKMTEMQPYWDTFSSFARARGVNWAVAEIGYGNEAAALDPGWITNAFTSMVRSGGIGMSYFDTSYNTLGMSWNLDLASKFFAWKKTVTASTRIC